MPFQDSVPAAVERTGASLRIVAFMAFALRRSPKSLGLSDDERRLGIGLEWMVLEESWQRPLLDPDHPHGEHTASR